MLKILLFLIGLNLSAFSKDTVVYCFRIDDYGIVSSHVYEEVVGVCDENFVGSCIGMACSSLIRPEPPKCFHYFASNHYTNLCIGSNIFKPYLESNKEKHQIVKEIYLDKELNTIYSLKPNSSIPLWMIE